jgi:hypothetical protein
MQQGFLFPKLISLNDNQHLKKLLVIKVVG